MGQKVRWGRAGRWKGKEPEGEGGSVREGNPPGVGMPTRWWARSARKEEPWQCVCMPAEMAMSVQQRTPGRQCGRCLSNTCQARNGRWRVCVIMQQGSMVGGSVCLYEVFWQKASRRLKCRRLYAECQTSNAKRKPAAGAVTTRVPEM